LINDAKSELQIKLVELHSAIDEKTNDVVSKLTAYTALVKEQEGLVAINHSLID